MVSLAAPEIVNIQQLWLNIKKMFARTLIIAAILFWDICDSNSPYCTKRIWTKVEGQYKVKVINVCCSGYTVQRKKCVPVCDQVCENGACTAPNTCVCNEGYTKFNDFRCIPYCKNCNHGFCLAPNICDCYTGYEMDNTGICQPKCSIPCKNGYCTQPNYCTCNLGYKHTSNSTYNCEPVCDNPCLGYSECAGPNICKCKTGYEMDQSNFCKPICLNCDNGICLAPGQCQCLHGFRKTGNGGCTPHCSAPCINGLCIKPETCSCNSGYIPDFDDYYKCNPVCKNCINGDCISPDQCQCWKGYSIVNGTCEPVCSKPCINGICFHKEFCKCNTGYKIDKTDLYKCNPVCENCKYGDCIAPNVCKCWKGYEMGLNDYCTPICEKICENGFCIQPNTCECNPNYELDEDDPYKCNPSCEDCEFTNCSDPDECGCCDTDENVTKSPTCELPCKNGVCSDTDTCTCNFGYEMDKSDRYKCNPLCHEYRYCDCIAPNVCECWEGHIMDENNICKPICNRTCDNGYCSPDSCTSTRSNEDDIVYSTSGPTKIYNPGEIREAETNLSDFENCDPECINGYCRNGNCICNDGFVSADNDTSECISECEKLCINGYCDQNNNCNCSEGYSFNGTSCDSVCNITCINGFCIEPNHCECFEGYAHNYNQTKRHHCIPLCDNEEDGCTNGTCIKPDICQCFPGFILSDDNKFLCIKEIFNYQQNNYKLSYVWVVAALLIALIVGIFTAFCYMRRNYTKNDYDVGLRERRIETLRDSLNGDNISVI